MPTQHLPVAGALLPEAGPAAARALREPAQLRPHGPGPADLDAGLLRGRAGARHRSLLHAGDAREHGGALGRGLHARGVPGAGEDRGPGGPRPVPVRPRVSSTAACSSTTWATPTSISHMMWRPMDPGHPAYDPVKDPPFADAVPVRLRAGRRPRELRPRPHGRGHAAGRHVGPRLHELAAHLPPERLAAPERLPRGAGREPARRAGAAHERGLDADAGLRLRPERPLRQPAGPREGRHRAARRARRAAGRDQAGARGDDRSLRPASPPSATSTCATRPTATAASARSVPTRSSATPRARGARTPRRSARSSGRSWSTTTSPGAGTTRWTRPTSRASWPPAGRSSAPPATCAS